MIIVAEKVVAFLADMFHMMDFNFFLGIAVDQLSMIMHTLAMLGECPEFEFYII